MELLQCLSWVSYLFGQAREKTAENESSIYLPYDIIVEIFTRLPAESIVQCRRCKLFRSFTATSRFVDMHLRRAAPTICFQYHTFPTLRPKTILDVDIYFTDDKVERITTKHFQLKSSFDVNKRGSMPVLYGSYRGLLLFLNFHDESVLHIRNPVTQSQVILVAPNRYYHIRGIYFHPASKEYRVLYEYVEGGCFNYIVVDLKTKSSRKIGRSSHGLANHKLPTIFNGALHWIVNDESCKEVLGVSPDCSKAIVIFNMDSEVFCTKPHPGGPCNLRTCHRKMMDLMEFDGHLCLCDYSSGYEIVVWILEDYTGQFWVKRHVLNIEPLWKYCAEPVGQDCDLVDWIEAIHIYGDDLFFRMFQSDLFLCNLCSGASKRIGYGGLRSNYCVAPVVYTQSLVSLTTSGIVYISP